MPFDPILGVGRSPQVTADVIVNSYAIQNIDIASSSKTDTSYSAGVSSSGFITDIVNDNFDLSSGDAYRIVFNSLTTGTHTAKLTFDLSKIVFVKQIDILSDYTTGTGITGGFTQLYIETSLDGNTWTLLNDPVQNKSFYYKKLRFLRFNIIFTVSSGTSSNWYISVNKLKIFLDNIQY